MVSTIYELESITINQFFNDPEMMKQRSLLSKGNGMIKMGYITSCGHGTTMKTFQGLPLLSFWL